MSNNFDWRTDEEIDWEALPDVPDSTPPPLRRRLYWFIAVVFVMVAVAGVVLARQVNENLAEVTAQVEADVENIHALVHQAAARGDVDVMRTILSARDRVWTDTQIDLIENGEFGQRQVLGLTAVSPGSSIVLTTTLSPNLKAAEVTAVAEFTTTTPDGSAETIQLLQTSIYRMGYRNWLYAPPLESDWGSNASYQGEWLTTVFPERDTVIATRLSEDLDALVGRLCGSLDDITCPDDYRVRIHFDTDSRLLGHALQLPIFFDDNERLTLPTPSLVGVPLDDSSYAAVFRGYAAQLASASLADLIDYECCVRAPYFTVLLEWQLSDLDLRPWPPEAIDYQELQQSWIGGTALNTLWGRESIRGTTDDFKLHLYSLVDMLRQHDAITMSPLAMIDALAAAEDYRGWLQAVGGGQIGDDLLETQWGQYAFQRAGATITAPTSFPSGIVEMMCSLDESLAQIMQFNPATAEWRQVLAPQYPEGRTGWINPLPVPNTYVFYSFDDVETGMEPINVEVELWQNGRLLHSVRPAATDASMIYYLPFSNVNSKQMSHNRYLIVVYASDEGPRYELMDTSDCQDGQCAVQPLAGLPVFATDGSQMLISSPFSEELRLARPDDLTQQEVVGDGRFPYWLTADRYVYLRTAADTSPETPVVMGQELATAVAGKPDSPSVLLTAEDIFAALPEPIDPEQTELIISTALTQNRILMQVKDSSRSITIKPRVYLVLVELDNSLTAVSHINLAISGIEGYRSEVQPSPNGEWLGYFDYVQNDMKITRTTTGDSLTLVDDMDSFTWLTDDLLVSSRLADLQFISTDGDVVFAAPHGFGRCWNVQWQPRAN